MFPIEFFFRAARRYPDRIALRDSTTALSFSDLAARVSALAEGLVQAAPTPLSRVGICAANSIDHVVALLGTLAAGKTWVPLNPRNGDAELERIVAFTQPSLIVRDEANAGRLNGCDSKIIQIDSTSPAGGDFERLLRAFQGSPPPAITAPLDAAQAIKFTGGTTGAPKGVMQPFRAWNTTIVTQMNCFAYTPADRYLVVAPITHGTSTFLLPILGSGGSLIFPADAKPPGILDAIELYGATTLFMPPTLVYALLAEQAARPRQVSSLRYLVYGAAPMRPEKIQEARAMFGDVVATTYGQTEAPQIASFMGPQEYDDPRNLASVGRPTLLTEIAVFDPDGRRVPAGERGEIAIRGDLVMSGYWRMPEKTAETIRGGWLYTGDIGCFDERGYLFLKDRSRDVIITGGFNVYPSDVENILGGHPAVYDCSVVGVEDEKWGEAVHAAVQLRPGEIASEQELIHYVKKALDSVKAPKVIHQFDELPRSSVGKVVKSEVLAEIARRMAPS